MTSFCSLCGQLLISHNSIPLPPVPTVASLRQQQRRVERRRGAARVVTAMQGGEALQKHFTRQGPVFSLTNGKPVSAEVAVVVIADIRVVAVNDGLFPSTPQTWRFVEQ